MDKERKLLRAAGILDCVIGGLTIPVFFWGIPLILIGLYLYTESKSTDEELIKNKTIYRVIAILSFFFNIISFAIVYTVTDNITKYEKKVNGKNAPPKKVVYKIDSESKKIDILLKLGVGMVFISGILFATTSWSFINNYIKAFALILFGAIFIVLSIFTEKKLKIYKSSFMYWLLGISFFLLTIVGILYFGIFGSYLTYTGAGKSLAYAITLLSAAGFLFATYLKFPQKYLANLSLLSTTIAVYNIAMYMSSNTIAICVIAGIVTILNIVNRKENIISNYTNLISYTILPISIIICFNDPISLFIASIINIINFNYKAVIEKDKNISPINILFTEILLFISVAKLNVFHDLNVSLIMLLVSLYTLLINTNILKSSNNTKLFNFIIYSLISLGIVLSSAISLLYDNTYNMIISSVIYLLIFTITRNGLFKSIKYEKLKYIEPIVLFFPVLSVPLTFIDNFSYIYVISIMALIYSIIGFITKDEEASKINLAYGIIGTIFVIQAFTSNKELPLAIINLITALTLFSKFDMKEDNNIPLKSITYILLLLSVYIPFVGMNILNISEPIIIITYIIITYLIALLLRKEHISKITNFQVIIPLLQMINYFNLNNTVSSILISLTFLYAVALFIKYFVKDIKAKNIIIVIALIIFLFEPFFLESIYGGIYIGIMGIVTIIYGFRKDEHNSIFITGIVITILNILYRLKGLWKLLPFWLYLLLGGLLIIGFVTYKEIKKSKK